MQLRDRSLIVTGASSGIGATAARLFPALFLLSDAGAFVTGSAILAEGGASIART